jgi:hypothetical protein
MRLRLFLLSACLILIPACENTGDYTCEASVIENVINNGASCEEVLYTLKFTKGFEHVLEAVGEGYELTDSICGAVNLPLPLRIEGLTILLDVRALEDDEHFSCYNMEMPLAIGPVVYITRAEIK